MRRLLVGLLVCALAVPAGAQQPMHAEAVHGHGFRFYLAPVGQVTHLNSEEALVTGLEFGWMVTPRLTLGLASYRLLNAIEADRPDASGARDLDFFYGGVSAAYGVEIAPRTRLIGQALIGGGQAHWRESFWGGLTDRAHRDADHRTALVAEPGIGLEAELAPWLRANVTGGYRYVTGGQSNAIEQKDLRAFTANFSLRFGRF